MSVGIGMLKGMLKGKPKGGFGVQAAQATSTRLSSANFASEDLIKEAGR